MAKRTKKNKIKKKKTRSKKGGNRLPVCPKTTNAFCKMFEEMDICNYDKPHQMFDNKPTPKWVLEQYISSRKCTGDIPNCPTTVREAWVNFLDPSELGTAPNDEQLESAPPKWILDKLRKEKLCK